MQVAPDSAGERVRIGQAGGALLCASLVGNGLNYLFLIGLSRLLVPTEFGIYALGLTIFNLVALVTVFGLDTGATKFVSHHLGLSQEADSRRMIVQIVWLGGVWGGLAGLVLAFVGQPLATGLYDKPDLASVLRWFAWAVPLSVMTMLLLAVLQASHTVRYTIGIKYVWEPFGKILLCGLLLWAGFGLTGILAGIVVVSAVSLFWSAHVVWRRASLRAGETLLPSRKGLRELAAYCLPVGMANLVLIVATRADVLLLGYWRQVEEVGLYLVAFQTAAVLTLVAGAFDAVIAPLLSRAWARSDRAALAQAYQEGTRLAVTVTIPPALVMVLFAPDILRLFNPQFTAGALCLVVLALGQWINSTTTFSNSVLLMGGESRVVMGQGIVGGILLLATAALLVPRWGILGAGASATGALVAVNAARLWEVWRRFHIHPLSWGLVSPLGAGLCTAVAVWSAKLFFAGAGWPILALLCLILYPGVLLFFGLHRDDRELVQALVNKLKPRAV